jgi:hypothetical protein
MTPIAILGTRVASMSTIAIDALRFMAKVARGGFNHVIASERQIVTRKLPGHSGLGPRKLRFQSDGLKKCRTPGAESLPMTIIGSRVAVAEATTGRDRHIDKQRQFNLDQLFPEGSQSGLIGVHRRLEAFFCPRAQKNRTADERR